MLLEVIGEQGERKSKSVSYFKTNVVWSGAIITANLYRPVNESMEIKRFALGSVDNS